MNNIVLSTNESIFRVILKKCGLIAPSKDFIIQARVRLIERINEAREPIFGWLALTKRVFASFLVMTIAVTSTLFFVDGGQIVSASEESYLEVINGEVTVKHADQLTWDLVSERTELAAGDIIRLKEDANATIHFFDDTELRLSENSTLLLSQLAVSPGYSRQGIIEVSLHQGKAWVQTLNVDDDYAEFVLSTRDSIFKTLNASFDVQSQLNEPTTIRVFENNVGLTMLNPLTRELVTSLKAKEDQKVVMSLALVAAKITNINSHDLTDDWVQGNLKKDNDHLSDLRQRDMEVLRRGAGTLPGEILYPVKQAIERLKLAITGKEHLTDAQIKVANIRLNEAMVLLENGERQKAWEAVMEYQSIVRKLAEESEGDEVARKIVSNGLVVNHKKVLVASLPAVIPVNMIKETLNNTEELLVTEPIDKERIRLENSVNRLKDVASLVEAGDFISAKEALINHKLVVTSILDEATQLEDNTEKQIVLNSILDLRKEELVLVDLITSNLANNDSADLQLIAMIESTNAETKAEMEKTIAFIKPLMPNVTEAYQEPLSAIERKAQDFADKINIYKSWTGQKNQVSRLVKEQSDSVKNVEFMMEVRDKLDGRARDLINVEILKIQREERLSTHKAVKRKIDSSKKLRR